MTGSPLLLSPRDQEIALRTFRVVTTWRPAGLRLPVHSHECTNLSLCASGQFGELVGTRWRRVTPATLIIRPAGEAHANDYSDGPSRAIVFELLPSAVRRFSEGTSVLQAAVCIDSAAVVSHVQRLKTELAHPDPVSDLVIEAILHELVVLASRSASSADHSPRWLVRVEELLRAKFNRRVGMIDLEEVAGVEGAQIAKAFRSRHRMTIGEYVRRLRVTHGARLLEDSRLSLSEIAAECGFYDQSHFSRAFSREMGISPHRFRKQVGA